MKNTLKIIAFFSLILLSVNATAADQTIEMLNKQGKESMVYSKKVVKVDVGETVFWKATTKGHNVEFIKGGVPDGVEKFKTKYNVDAEYTFTIPSKAAPELIGLAITIQCFSSSICIPCIAIWKYNSESVLV